MNELLLSYACCVRRKSTEEAEQRERSQKIDKQIEKDKLHLRRQVKLLLLGAGESGKSTFLKQMKIIHGHNFDDAAVAEFRSTIYMNVVKGMKVLVDARDKLRIQWAMPDNALLANRLIKLDSVNLDSKLFMDYVSIVRVLWMDEAIRAAYCRRREFQLADSVRYFFDNLDRIGSANYVPSNQDILHCRKATKGISEFKVAINSIPFLFVDVGGQRSQRQKWFQCFDSVTSILFLVSSSEFDQVILEDRFTNRLVEARNIFETIINNRCFMEVSVIVFLNKTDLLRQKVERTETDIRNYFSDFTGHPHDLDDVQKYMVGMFDGVRRDRRRPLFHHLTTAVDTENIKVVFNAVRDTILQKNLKQLMLQ